MAPNLTSKGKRLARERIRSIDVLRGLAMVLVILSHVIALLRPGQLPAIADLALARIANLASVSFVSVSGLMLTYFLRTHADPRAVQQRFARRAAFLLIAVHPVLLLSTLPWDALAFDRLLFRWYVTDTIALCLLAGPPVILWTNSRGKALGVGVLLTSSIVAKALWQPSGLGMVAKEVLTGEFASVAHVVRGQYPLVPWFAVFLTGSILGERLASAAQTGALGRLVANLRREAIRLALIGLMATAGYRLLAHLDGPTRSSLLWAAYPDRLTTLFPLYIGVFGLLAAAVIWHVEVRLRFRRIEWAASVLGRTSLFAFVTQFVLVWSVPTLVGLRGQLDLSRLPIVSAFALLSVWLASYSYGVLRGRIEAAPGQEA